LICPNALSGFTETFSRFGFLISLFERFCPLAMSECPFDKHYSASNTSSTGSSLSSVTTRSCGSASLRMRYCGKFPLGGRVGVT